MNKTEIRLEIETPRREPYKDLVSTGKITGTRNLSESEARDLVRLLTRKSTARVRSLAGWAEFEPVTPRGDVAPIWKFTIVEPFAG